MSGSIVFTASDLVIESSALGLVLFAFIFYLLAWRKFESKTYLSILILSAIMAVYLAAGIIFKVVATGRGSIRYIAAYVVIQELCLPIFLSVIPFFWSCFLTQPRRLQSVNRYLAIGGLAFASLTAAAALLRLDLFLHDFRFDGDVIRFRIGLLYYLTHLPIGLFLIYSQVLIVLDAVLWKNLRSNVSIIVGGSLAVLFAFSSIWKSLTGNYLDPLFSVRFSRIIAALSLFSLCISYGFIRRFLSEAQAVRRTRDSLDALLVTDSLTGLPNRRACREDLGSLAAGAARHAIILVDIDGFNDINESYGSEQGDAVLKAIPKALTPSLPIGSKLYRMGGDEFMAIFPFEGSHYDAEGYTSALRLRLGKGVEGDSVAFPLDASFAIAVIPDDGKDPELILSMSYSCLQAAKRERNGVKVYSRAWHDESLRKIATVRALRRDLAAGLFHLEYQPIHDRAKQVSGAEALIRWDNDAENRGPSAFIPIAESAGLMRDLGRLVLDLLAEDLGAELEKPGFPSLSVNLSPLQLMDADFTQGLMRKVEAIGLRYSRLQWEVTESALLDRDSRAVYALRQLREAGSQIAIDDFGSGYSNLGYLRTLPVDKLKIDKTFLTAVPGDAAAESLVMTLSDLGLSLNLDLIAEGVENGSQYAFLRRAGYREFQGYHFSPPLPRAAFLSYLAKTGGPGSGLAPAAP